MRKLLLYTMLYLSICLLITSCQNATKVTNEAKLENIPTPSSVVKPQATEKPIKVDPVITPKPSDEPKKPVPSETDQPKTKQYYMNKNYFFKPIDPKGKKEMVLLTFDDGPKEKEMLTKLLDILDQHHAKAIFFVNGYRVKAHPELLKLIADRHQAIGNHSWDHIDLKKEKKEKISKQIMDVQTIVKEVTGITPQFFRPPFGLSNEDVRKLVHDNGMLHMTWSNGSLDWTKAVKDKPDQVIKNVLEQLNYGSNILMHELPWTVDALDDLLTKIEEKGYGFIDPDTIELQVK